MSLLQSNVHQSFGPSNSLSTYCMVNYLWNPCENHTPHNKVMIVWYNRMKRTGLPQHIEQYKKNQKELKKELNDRHNEYYLNELNPSLDINGKKTI